MVVLYISLYFTIYYTIETHIGTLRFWSYSSPIIKYPSLLLLLNIRLNRLGHWRIIYPLLYPM